MSVRVQAWVWEHSQAEGMTRLVLLAIADSAEDDGSDAWPSFETLTKKCHCSESTVRRAIRRLEELGELEFQRVRHANGQLWRYSFRVPMGQLPLAVENSSPAVNLTGGPEIEPAVNLTGGTTRHPVPDHPSSTTTHKETHPQEPSPARYARRAREGPVGENFGQAWLTEALGHGYSEASLRPGVAVVEADARRLVASGEPEGRVLEAVSLLARQGRQRSLAVALRELIAAGKALNPFAEVDRVNAHILAGAS